jgi:RNA cap guanine-N2 methyltransferase
MASRVVMFLPRNTDLNQLAELALSVDPPWSLEACFFITFFEVVGEWPTMIFH